MAKGKKEATAKGVYFKGWEQLAAMSRASLLRLGRRRAAALGAHWQLYHERPGHQLLCGMSNIHYTLRNKASLVDVGLLSCSITDLGVRVQQQGASRGLRIALTLRSLTRLMISQQATAAHNIAAMYTQAAAGKCCYAMAS